MAAIAPRLLHLDRAPGAALVPALRAAHALRDIDQPRIPTSERRERLRVAFSRVPTGTDENEFVLAEFIRQLVDVEGHDADFETACQGASIQ